MILEYVLNIQKDVKPIEGSPWRRIVHALLTLMLDGDLKIVSNQASLSPAVIQKQARRSLHWTLCQLAVLVVFHQSILLYFRLHRLLYHYRISDNKRSWLHSIQASEELACHQMVLVYHPAVIDHIIRLLAFVKEVDLALYQICCHAHMNSVNDRRGKHSD